MADIRDQLAVERTRLANERTMLAYVRTALALTGAGVGALKLLDGQLWWVLGWLLSVSGVLLLGIGLYRFRQVNRELGA